MKKNVSIIGGDLRLILLAKLFKEEGVNCYTYGLEKADILENVNIEKCESLKKCIEKSNLIISSIPFSKDNNFVNGTYNENKIKIEDIARHLENKTFIAGKIPEKFYEITKTKNVKIIDLLKSEEFAILNSISTVEGAIKVAIEETDYTIHGSNILILGFGRIGKMLAKVLTGMEAKVFCEARKKEDLAWIEAYGYEKIPLQNLSDSLKKYDIIFNTIPYVILDEEKLKLLKKEVLIIDLASSPGGIDRKTSELLGIKTKWLLALPGKVAPKSAAEIIKQTIENELKR